MSFKIGDKVTMKDGQQGTIVEMVPNQTLADGTLETLYSVRLEPWPEEKFQDVNGNDAVRYRHPETKEVRDHPSDCLGAVRAGDMKEHKEHKKHEAHEAHETHKKPHR